MTAADFVVSPFPLSAIKWLACKVRQVKPASSLSAGQPGTIFSGVRSKIGAVFYGSRWGPADTIFGNLVAFPCMFHGHMAKHHDPIPAPHGDGQLRRDGAPQGAGAASSRWPEIACWTRRRRPAYGSSLMGILAGREALYTAIACETYKFLGHSSTLCSCVLQALPLSSFVKLSSARRCLPVDSGVALAPCFGKSSCTLPSLSTKVSNLPSPKSDFEVSTPIKISGSFQVFLSNNSNNTLFQSILNKETSSEVHYRFG